MDTGTAAARALRGLILVVDDEAHIRELAEIALRPHGFDVVVAEDGPAGLELHARHRGAIDLIVLDIRMPEMSGFEVLQRLIERDPEVRVILSTGVSSIPADYQFPPQVVGVLPKPYRPADLAARVCELVPARADDRVK